MNSKFYGKYISVCFSQPFASGRQFFLLLFIHFQEGPPPLRKIELRKTFQKPFRKLVILNRQADSETSVTENLISTRLVIPTATNDLE